MVNISNNVKLNQTSSKIYQRKCQDLTEIVRNRLDYLQNPANCSTAKKLICDVWGAGMGSVVHHWVCCLIYAYNTNRTMFIDLRQWPYLQGVTSKDGVKQFEDLFQPISKCRLTDYDNKTAITWPISKSQLIYNHNISVIRILAIGKIYLDKLKLPQIFHFALPTKLFYRTIDFKYQPIAWWIGLLAKHIIRPNHTLQQFSDQSRKKFKFQSPIVGLHIRRTDKRTEAKLFNIDQYMVKVKAFFNRLAKQSIQIEKRVFVITDEPWLINQLIKKYPDYHFVHPPIKQLTASTFTSRYSAIHLKYFIRDLFLLAECDYLVVTMSSNVGRLAYELHEVIYSQTKSKHYTSLDDDYFIQGLYRNLQAPQIMRANQDCRSNILNGISIVEGDLLDSCISSNHSNTMY
ncbi:Alpha-(1,6)-fucosyltransferase [Trichoplax sp. H2]|nr:Alpha-(1,6)-fucosyltransferase [Trichoplax sp. H2]|eukprot:RDD36018.1 Alpha-(1,6)-fucosyltransferase [Trichoplax sp. H2]